MGDVAVLSASIPPRKTDLAQPCQGDKMIAVTIKFSRVVQIVTLAAILTLPQTAFTQCAGIKEEGRWRNLEKNGDPAFIDVKMTGGCGDQVLNGQETGGATRYTIRVWVRQSTGKLSGRPPVKAV